MLGRASKNLHPTPVVHAIIFQMKKKGSITGRLQDALSNSGMKDAMVVLVYRDKEGQSSWHYVSCGDFSPQEIIYIIADIIQDLSKDIGGFTIVPFSK
jgi:hypothetical protein